MPSREWFFDVLNLFHPEWITKINKAVIEIKNVKKRKKVPMEIDLPANVVADIMRLTIEVGKYFILR